MWEQVKAAVGAIQAKSDKKFGDPQKPLLVSCRSGAKFSMPGMMDTVLNIGLNDETAQAMIALTGDARFVFDAYRRLIQMFGSVVMGVPDEVFEEKITQLRAKTGAKTDTELTGDNWIFIIKWRPELTGIGSPNRLRLSGGHRNLAWYGFFSLG